MPVLQRLRIRAVRVQKVVGWRCWLQLLQEDRLHAVPVLWRWWFGEARLDPHPEVVGPQRADARPIDRCWHSDILVPVSYLRHLAQDPHRFLYITRTTSARAITGTVAPQAADHLRIEWKQYVHPLAAPEHTLRCYTARVGGRAVLSCVEAQHQFAM